MKSRPCLAALTLLAFTQVVVFAAQPPQPPAWVRRAGSNNFDRAETIAVDAAGNVLLGGPFLTATAFGTNVFFSVGGDDGFIAKFDAAGSNLWARAFGGPGDDEVHTVAFDPAGNVYVSGDYTGSVDFGGTIRTSAGSNDCFVAKYDGSGNLAWVFTGGGTGRDEGWNLGLDAATNVYVAGFFAGNPNYGGTVIHSAGAQDIALMKLNPAGALQWIVTGGGPKADETRGMTVDAAGNSYIVGTVGSNAVFGSYIFPVTGGVDALVLKYDSGGNLVWAFSGGGPTNDAAERVAVDSAGNVFFNGFFGAGAQFGTNALTNAGDDDFFTAKLDAAGNLQWIRTGGGPGEDFGAGVAVDLAGNVFSTGHFRTGAVFDGVALTNASSGGTNDIALLKYDADGTLVWAQRFGSTRVDQGWDMTSDALGNIYFAGDFGTNVNFGITNLQSAGSQDIFWAKLVTVTPPAPVVTPAGTNVQLSWSVLASEFRLESAAALGGPTVWTNVPGVPAIVGVSNVLNLPANALQQFFRLNWP